MSKVETIKPGKWAYKATRRATTRVVTVEVRKPKHRKGDK